MSRESIRMVKQTEQEAERILREAQEKAAQMVADAEANGIGRAYEIFGEDLKPEGEIKAIVQVSHGIPFRRREVT